MGKTLSILGFVGAIQLSNKGGKLAYIINEQMHGVAVCQ